MHLAHHHLYNWNIFHLHYSELALLQIVILIITPTLLLTTIDFCSYQVKKTITRKTKFDAAEACKNHVWFHCMKCCFSSVSFTVVVRQGKWGLLYVIFNIGKAVVLWITCKHFAWIILGNRKWNIYRHPSKLFPNFLRKNTYLAISQLGKNMSIAMQNMTESF